MKINLAFTFAFLVPYLTSFNVDSSHGRELRKLNSGDLWKVEPESSRHTRDGDGKELRKLYSGDLWKYLSTLDQSISRQMELLESRLNRNVEERIQSVNQSAAIAHVERLLHYVNEELSLSKTPETKISQELIEGLQLRTEEQQAEIDDLRKTVSELEKTVATLVTAVRKLEEGGTEGGNENGAEQTFSSTVKPTVVQLPVDCQEAADVGGLASSPGFYHLLIQPRVASEPFKACCYVNQSGWTVIQRRVDGSVDFYRDWDDYKKGFGDLDGEFWIGNERIYQLTNQDDYRLRVEMKTWDEQSHWAEYRHFRVADEADKYRLHVSGYRGNAGNSLSSPWENDHNGQQFSTRDSDNDNRFYDNCAEHFHGAWWFKSCFQSHLNGVYYPKESHSNFFVRNGIQWNSIHPHSSLKEVVMMIKANANDTLPNGIEPEP